MRPAHTLSRLLMATLAAAPLALAAQGSAPDGSANSTPQAVPAALPDVGVVAPTHQALAHSGGVESAQTDWRSANASVAAFPRGHADIVAWEAAQTAAAKGRTHGMPASMPHSSQNRQHGQHGHHSSPAATQTDAAGHAQPHTHMRTPTPATRSTP